MQNRIACYYVKQFLPFQPFSPQGQCRVLWMKSHFLDCQQYQSFQVDVKLLLQQAYDSQQLIPPYYEDVHQGSMSAAFPTVEKLGVPLIICNGNKPVSITNVIDHEKIWWTTETTVKEKEGYKKVIKLSKSKNCYLQFCQ